MNCLLKGKSKFLLGIIGGLLFLVIDPGRGHASNVGNLFKDTGIKIGGWVNAGATYNPSYPSNGYNGSVTFADRANRFQLNQFNVFLQRTVVTEGNAFEPFNMQKLTQALRRDSAQPSTSGLIAPELARP